MVSAALIGSVSAQNFTNTVDTTVNARRTFEYFYNVDPDLKIDKPIIFKMELEGTPTATIAATLLHQGTSYSLFEDTPATPEMTSGPIDDFLGKRQGGAWVLSIKTDNPIYIKDWSIVPNIPEPSSFALCVIGGIILGLIRRRK